MIQRIQSVYLLLALIAAVLLFFIPIADLTNEVGTFKEYLYLSKEVYFMLMAGFSGFLSLITIFLFKNRRIQIILCFINILLTAALMFTIIMNIENTSDNYPADVEGSYTWGTFIPFLIIIFVSLALRAIKNDERLVRSMDRLR